MQQPEDRAAPPESVCNGQSVPAASATAEPPRHGVRDGLLLALAVAAMAAWLAAPRVLRHLAHDQPLFYQTVTLPAGVAAGDGSWRFDLPPTRWSAVWNEVLEDGLRLERAKSPRALRGGARGAYHAREGVILVAPRERARAPEGPGHYELRRPRELRRSTVLVVSAGFATIHLLLVALLLTRVRWRGALAALARTGVAVAVAVAILRLLDGPLPESTADLLGEKLNQYEGIAAEIDTVFLGSSRVYRHFDPATFAATFAEHGRKASSFNLGVPDMRMLEVLYHAERVVERSPELRLLVVEPEDDPLFVREENLLTQRVRRWHDLETLLRIAPEILRSARARDDEVAGALVALLERVDLAAHRLSLIGRGADAVDALLRDSPRWIEPDRRGFLSLDDDRRAPRTETDRVGLERRYRDLHEAIPAWESSLQRFRRTSPAGRLVDPFELRLFAELQRLADRRGFDLVFVISPRIGRLPNLVHARETGVIERLVRFDDIDLYPGFYETGARYDRHHLDGDAAAELTRLLALELLEPGERSDAAAAGPGTNP